MYTADVLCATAFGKDLGMLESKKSGMVVDVKILGCSRFVEASSLPRTSAELR